MSEDEVEVVAIELAKIGGLSWYPGRKDGPLLRTVSERFKACARTAIGAIDRFRACHGSAIPQVGSPANRPVIPTQEPENEPPELGSIVVYRPPGERRKISCRVTDVAANRVYLTPLPQPAIGWVPLNTLSTERICAMSQISSAPDRSLEGSP